ncbi:MAG: type II secretion system F family protein [Desulfitobacterium hafniense]|nr:type II secretion system F family protein [Desulfitobacterium hafniense]
MKGQVKAGAAKFKWRAIDSNGKIHSGSYVADDLKHVISKLRTLGYYPVKIRHQLSLSASFNQGVSVRDWIRFARKLSLMLEAGIPLLKSLEIITANQGDLHQDDWLLLKERISGGYQLSEALQLMNPPPPLFLRSMVMAGEHTGNLVRCIEKAADELEKAESFRRKLVEAVTYPLLLLLGIMSVFFVLGNWVLPIYERLFAGFDAELPVLTRAIFVSGRQLPIVFSSLIAVVIVFLLLIIVLNPNTWKLELERRFIKIPLVGEIYLLGEIIQFNRLLGEMIEAGIPLLEALNLVLRTTRSELIKYLLLELTLGVRQGRRIAPILKNCKEFPSEAGEMVMVGEESGKLGVMFSQVSQILTNELEHKLGRIANLIGPVLTIGLAGLIGLVAVGVLLPMFEATTHFK